MSRGAATDAPDQTLGAGLAAAVAELELAATNVGSLQQQLSPLLRRGGEGLEPLQALDDLNQHLLGLGAFLAAVARDCPSGLRFDRSRAVEPLTLHEQKLRLSCGADTPSAGPVPTGELELW